MDLDVSSCTYSVNESILYIPNCRDVTMKKAKPAKAYKELLNQFELDLGLTLDQVDALEKEQPILLSKEQLDFIVDQFIVVDGIDEFLVKYASN